MEHIKLIERVNIDRADPCKLARTYLSREYDGNLLSLLYAFQDGPEYLLDITNKELDGFLDFWLRHDPDCRNKCGGECRYCETYLDRHAEITGEAPVRERIEQFPKFGVVNRLESVALQRVALEARI